MKAKEYAEKHRLGLLNPRTRKETAEVLFNEFLREFYETLRKRNVQTDKGFENTLTEFNLKWNKLVKLVPYLKENGFKHAIKDLIVLKVMLLLQFI